MARIEREWEREAREKAERESGRAARENQPAPEPASSDEQAQGRWSVVSFRVSAKEAYALREAAGAAGMSLSKYCRSRTLGHRVVSKIDLVAINELRRQGGLLKHVALETGTDTSAALSAVVAAVNALSRAVS